MFEPMPFCSIEEKVILHPLLKGPWDVFTVFTSGFISRLLKIFRDKVQAVKLAQGRIQDSEHLFYISRVFIYEMPVRYPL